MAEENVDFIEEKYEKDEILNPIKPEDLIYFIIFVLGILSNIIIIYFILRFKKMKTKLNLTILNWSIASSFTLITQMRSYKLITHTFGLNIYSNFLCYTLEYQTIFHTACTIFMLLLCIDYIYIKFTFKQLILTFVIIWSKIISLIVVSTILCAYAIYIPYPAVILKITFFTFLIVMLIKWCFYKKTNNLDKIKLTISSCFLIYWLIFWITLSANIIFYTNVIKNFYIFILSFVYLYPIVNLILLIYIDKNFKLCLLQTLRCSNKYVEATICYKEETNNVNNCQEHDINDENSSVDITLSYNNENM